MLKLRFKNNKLNAVWLVEPKVSIGKSPSCDLIINSPDIADHHADILVKHEKLALVNVSGSKRIAVNGKSVEKGVRLKVNDEVSLGSTVLEIIDPKAEIAGATKPVAKPLDGTGWALKSNHSALANRVFPIKSETIIGRSNECDITLAAAHLSRRHVKLTVQDGLLFVKDLGSANGTFLNGERITEARVKRGDELRFDTLCFGVIGPVEDMDKTTIRKLEPATSDPAPKPKHHPAAGKAPKKKEPQLSERVASAAKANLVDPTYSSEVADEGPRRGLIWGLALAGVVVIGIAIAYQQGLLDSFLK